MIFFVLTENGFKEVEQLFQGGNVILWLNKGILESGEINELRKIGMDITNFTYYINPDNKQEVLGALSTISEHHPDQSIWTEYKTAE